jgi:hypothetical protein
VAGGGGAFYSITPLTHRDRALTLFIVICSWLPVVLGLAMPQPINRIVSDPEVYLQVDILKDKPELAVLVAEIFSVWARIELELSYLWFEFWEPTPPQRLLCIQP